MNINVDEILYIIGNKYNCFAIHIDKSILKLSFSILDVSSGFDIENLYQINDYTIINTKFFIEIIGARSISMKDGSIHRVSRKKWKKFKIS